MARALTGSPDPTQWVSTDPLWGLQSALELSTVGRTRKFECVDLFSGAGGLSIGLRAAGFKPIAAVELDEDSCATYSSSSGSIDILNRDVATVDFRRFEGVDLLAGGPPCQPFSSGGKGLASADPRDMIPQFVRAVSQARPRAFLLENVPGLFGATHRPYLSAVVGSLHELGYSISAEVLYAPDYGVPQRRRRGFIVGIRSGTFLFPPRSHGSVGEAPYVPSGAVVDPLNPLGDLNRSRVFYAKTPDLRPSPFDGQLFNGGGRPINLAEPAPTILACAGGNKTHFFDTLGLVPKYHARLVKGGEPRTGTLQGARRLTVEESALLQTFPRGMRFFGSRSSQYTQVGNAVPPILAKAVGHAVYASLRESSAL